jgi:hypothetical protein
MAKSVTEQVTEDAHDRVVDSKDKVEDAQVQGKSEGEATTAEGHGGGSTESVEQKETNATAGEQAAVDADSVAVDSTVSEKGEAATEETEDGAKADNVQATASEMDDEETARADEVEARKKGAAGRVAERDVDKATSESEDVTKDRTEDDVSQLAEDTVSMKMGHYI